MPIKHIAIIGGGLAGWMAASTLARVFGSGRCNILIIEDEKADCSMGPHIPVMATLPSARLFHAQFGHSEDDIITKTSGCFTLGNAISGCNAGGITCFHPYGDTGAPLGHVSFHHLAAKLRSEGATVNLPDFSIAALCAQTNRFIRAPNDDASVLSTLDYGVILDTALYTNYFREDALGRGVIETRGSVEHVALDEADLICSVTVSNGESIEADFFIDCTGDKASLMRFFPSSSFQSWSHWLPCDTVTVNKIPRSDAPALYTHLAAATQGWTHFLATRSHISECRMAKDIRAADAQRFNSGHRCAGWAGNCLAVGAAAATIDPLSPLSLHLLQSSIRRLIDLFPNDRLCLIEARNYNQDSIEELESARDWAILPYKINGRNEDAFWDQCRNMAVPDRLEHRIELYKATGRVALYDGDIFEEADWVALFDAHGIYPRRYDPAANSIPVNAIKEHFQRIREIMLAEVAKIPFYQDYLRSITQ
jgi:tryptophan 7-halogenase